MALIACPECRREVSTAAAACPHCGYPLRGAARPPDGWIGKLAAVFGAWIVAPWVARVLVFIAACIVAIVALLSRG